MSQGNARWGIGATGAPGPTGAQGPKGDPGTGSSGIALSQLNPINTSRILARVSPGSGIPEELTGQQIATLLPAFTLLAAGLVPAPGSTTGRVLQDDGTWVAQTGGGGTPSGITLAQQALAGPFTIQGRNAVGTGTREDLAPVTVGSMIGQFLGSGPGLVPLPTGGALGRMLRDDGKWAMPSFVASGVGLTQLGDISSPRVLGRVTGGSGSPQQLVGLDVATMLPLYQGSGFGLVPAPTGGQQSRFLGEGGQWAIPLASGIANAALAPMLAPSIKGRITIGSGAPEDLSPAQVAASMLPKFGGSGVGVVPAPTGGTSSGFFLRIDGQFAAPSGIQDSQLSVLPPSVIRGRSGSSGTIENLVPSAVATMLPVFNNIDKGLVPPGAGGGSANFLRADGQWAAPSVGAGVSGLTLSQLADISAPRFIGRLAGSGTAQELTPLSAASMLPRMLGSGFGLVVAPTGGTAGNFLRDDGSWQAAGAASTPSGVTNAQLAFAPPLTIKGNNSATATGTVQDLTPLQVASLLGLVSVPSLSAGLFLRDDGNFVGVPSSVATGLTFAQQVNRPPFTFDGRFTLGTGVTESVTNYQAASMLPLFYSSGTSKGLVMGPSAVTGKFLSDDGSWGTPAGGSASGIANNQLLPMPPFTFKGRSTLGSGIPEDLSIGQVASLLPRFLGSGPGLVPQPSGASASGMFLRDDGKWGSPTGLGNGQFALMPPATIKGTPGATGLPQDLVGSGVATLLPVFNNVDKGLVPGGSNGGTSNFLRADGSWAAPSVGAGVSGLTLSQIGDVSPLTILGKSSNASGTIEQMSPLSVASLLPRFSGTGVGLVNAPTGGASGYFLRDDGSFVNLIPRVERLVGNVGSGATVGSATIDFTTDPYQQVNLFGNTQFKITPPTLHRHTQLRMTVGASGRSPTFYGTAVKWMGGSGAAPSWSTGSGIVNFANFFYDGTIMWGQAGIGAG